MALKKIETHLLFAATLALEVLACAGLAGMTFAAQPPQTLHYQGVLRDAADAPRNGDFDMIFRFFDAATAGNELLIDRHQALNAQAVTVTGGTFDVALGAGQVIDGAGPGTYGSLTDVFAGHADVWMEIQIRTETLAPRVRVHSAPFALNTDRLGGMGAGSFLDATASAQTKAGNLVLQGTGPASYGIEARGTVAGARFESISFPTWADLANNSYGVYAAGTFAGAQFQDTAESGVAILGTGDEGIVAHGTLRGGHFQDTDSFSEAEIASGAVGVIGRGPAAGARFYDSDSSGNVWLGFGDIGVRSYGGTFGVWATNLVGDGEAVLAQSHYGVSASGDWYGGQFSDTDSTGEAWVGYGDRGIWAKGSFSGGTFSSNDNVSFWADVATPTRKIVGTGTVSFVQNHPHDPSRVIVYAAPEGDEVATYTRGSGRLVDGHARIDLGPTFSLVTNPDLGLTVHLTSREQAVALAAPSLTTRELVVRGPAGSNVAFDYLVYGLRIGFEDAGVIVPKVREALPPSDQSLTAERGGLDAVAAASAGGRFRASASRLGRSSDKAAGGAQALRDAIAASGQARVGEEDGSDRPVLPEPRDPNRAEDPRASEEFDRPVPGRSERPRTVVATTSTSEPPQERVALHMPVAPGVRPGDALGVDLAEPWRLIAVSAAYDRTVVGIAVGESSRDAEGMEQIGVATGGVVEAHVDAAYGEIAIGDLLVASETPGHLMRVDALLPGTVVAKALEPLIAGSAEIRVLVMPR